MSEVVPKVTDAARRNAMINAIAMGRSIEAAAKHAGVGTRTVENWIKRPGFMDAVRKERTRMATETGSALLSWSHHAARYLMTVAADPNETTANRTKAAALVLSEGRAWLDASVLARIDELEERAGVQRDEF